VKEILVFAKIAEESGRQVGAGRAEWAIDPQRMSQEQIRRILRGIEDGDPAVMEGYRPPDLNGEYTPDRLAIELGIPTDHRYMDVYGDLWEEAAENAFWEKIGDTLRSHLGPE